MSRVVDLEQKCQFRTLLHPVRQEMIHLLRLTGRSLSANALAKRMNLSPVAAQGHLKKLVDLGIVLTEERPGKDGGKIVLYSLDDVDIRLHLGKRDAFQGDREAMAANLVDGTFRGLINTTYQHPDTELDQYTLLRFGALHLTPEEREELSGLIAAYLSTHGVPTEQRTEPWEYVLMAYRAPEENKH